MIRENGSFNHRFIAAVVCLGLLSAGAARSTVYYEYELAAQTGTSSLISIENEVSINERGQVAFIGDQNALSGFESVYVGAPGALAVSINPGFSAAGRVFGPGVEINHAGPAQVGARDALSGNSFFRLWDASTGSFTIIDRSDTGPFFDVGFRPGANDSGQRTHGSTSDPSGSPELLVLPGGGTVTVTNLALGLRPAIANDGSVVARVGMAANHTDPIVYYDAAGMGMTVASTGTGWTELGRAPGINQDGSIVVWCGNRGEGLGVFAIEVSDLPVTSAGDSVAKTVRIAGENAVTTSPDLGYDAAGGDIFLTFTNAQRDSKVGIALQETAGPGLTAGNSFVVTFLGTPSAASIDNPKLPPGTPLFFSSQAGLWAARVDLENELEPPLALVFNPNSATPVAQIGETLHTPSGSFAINSITELYDPIANVALDSLGMPRTQRSGDHQVAFRATSGTSTIVIRAVQRDSDEDGLYDHWEEAGGGIDVDRDGAIDLDLNALGAAPLQRDIFVEIDWTHPRVDPPRSYSNQPADGATAIVRNVFAIAPALPNGIPMGITAHIDAGPGNDTLGEPFSQNFMTGHQGGDLVGQVGMPTAHLDLVYFGTPGSFSIPGAQARSLQEIKQNFFGSADKFAREFAFHYLVLADSYAAYEDFAEDLTGDGVYTVGDRIGGDGVLTRGEATYVDAGKTPRSATPAQPTVATATMNSVSVNGFNFPAVGPGLSGHGVLITSGTGAGQFRQIIASSASPAMLTINPNWNIIPSSGDSLVLLSSSSGLSEEDLWPKPNNHGVPGNDFLVTFGSWDVTPKGFLAGKLFHWHTIVHELGHNLGLRHCGTSRDPSDCPNPAHYLSLMSYAHQNDPGSTVNSYSGPGDPAFNDWFNLRPDFNRAQVHLGGSRLFARFREAALAPGAIVTAGGALDLDPDYYDAVQANGGPLDVQPPVLDITSPIYGASFLQGQNMPVVFTATDNVALAPGSVNVRFDVDGSGAIDQTGETLIGTRTANPNEFTVTFTNLAGTDGLRNIDARASDAPMDNVGQDIVPIFVPEPHSTLLLLCAIPMIGLLQKRRSSVRGESERKRPVISRHVEQAAGDAHVLDGLLQRDRRPVGGGRRVHDRVLRHLRVVLLLPGHRRNEPGHRRVRKVVLGRSRP